ncbi:unnamed protein product [Diamesa serratosioi]
MVSQILLLTIVGLFLYRCYKYCFYRPPNFPPGPPRIPIFGSYLFLLIIDHKNLHKAIKKLCSYYKSSVIGFYTGSYLTVVANDQQSIRDILYRSEFDGRSDFLIARLREPNFKLNGIFFIDGLNWKEQRRFTLRHLRDFGFGRRFEDFEVEVRDEMSQLVDMIKNGPKYEHEHCFLRKGGFVSFPNILISSLGNSFLQVVSGERITRSEQHKLLNAGIGAIAFQKYSNEYGKLFGIMPWIRHVFPNISSFKQLRKVSMDMYELMEEIIKKQINTYQEGHVRSFMDMYIKEIKEAELKGEKSGFLYDQMVMICTDFLFPSISAIETQISFLFKHLVYRTDIVETIQKEIDNVVGSGRLPELDDRINLPFTEATLREIMRYETLVPSSVPHRALVNTQLNGYDIPKDTIMLAGLIALHSDDKIWKDPENFRPERFLDVHGKLSLKKDVSLPFGAGKRLCAGETFARNTMFMCITALLQNFTPKLPENVNLQDLLEQTDCGLARLPKDFWIILETR